VKVIQIMPEFALAGAEIMCEDLSYKLQEKGVDVVIVSLYHYHSPITERLEEKGIKVIYLNKKPGLDLSMIYKLYILFKKENPDVIHTHRYVLRYAMPAAILAKVKKCVHTFHSIATKEHKKFGRKINKIFFRFFNVIPVALSDIVKHTVVEEYKLNENKIPVIFNGIDLSKCTKKTDYSLHNPIRVIHIGRFADVKNHNSLIKAAKILSEKDYNFIISCYGEGNLKSECIKLAQELNIEKYIEFNGLTENVCEKLYNSDVFILPSLYEGIPMTVIEAMGTGIPIVVSQVGGVPDMVEDYKEALYCSIDPESIAKKLEELILNADLRKELGYNAYDKSQVFSSENMADKYIYIYREG